MLSIVTLCAISYWLGQNVLQLAGELLQAESALSPVAFLNYFCWQKTGLALLSPLRKSRPPSIGIRKISCKPYSPEGKGKIERFFGTVRSDFLSEPEVTQVQTLPDLNRLFWSRSFGMEVDYHGREHRTTKVAPLARQHRQVLQNRQRERAQRNPTAKFDYPTG